MSKAVNVKNFYEYWEELSSQHKDTIALKDDYIGAEYTFNSAFEAIKNFASGLKSLGLKKNNHISFFSENSARWMIADQAILISGMVDALRGSSASIQELEYILEQSDSVALIVENTSLLNKLSEKCKQLNLKCIIYLSNEKFENKLGIPVYSFEEVMSIGQNQDFAITVLNQDNLATLIYTSGTTGNPKGVMITQGNLLSQVKNAHPSIQVDKKGSALCILPIWHAYERAVEYYLLSQGVTLTYTNLKNFKNDFQKYQPSYLIAVPRIWDSIYEGIKKNIATMPKSKQNFINYCISKSKQCKNAWRTLTQTNIDNFAPNIWQKTLAAATFATTYPIHSFANKTIYKQIKNKISPNFAIGISGGGAFPMYLDEFFDAIGLEVFNGYGLTESSPIIGVRNRKNTVLGSIGTPLVETQIKIVDAESKKELKNATKGVLCIKGPQVMRGYYKNPEASQAVISSDGWLNTGDLVSIAPNGSIIITGRAKDTIVLSNGENIEPQGIEDVCLQSPFIKQIVLVGQDKPSLGALVVPDYDNIEAMGMLERPVLQLIQQEVKDLVQSRKNYMSFERISSIRLINEEFSLANGMLTQTVKIRRNKVFDKYSDVIEDMFS